MRGNARILPITIFALIALIAGIGIASANETVSRVNTPNLGYGAGLACQYNETPLLHLGGRDNSNNALCSLDVTVPSLGDFTNLANSLTTLKQTVADNKKQVSDDQDKLRTDLTAQIGNVLTPALLKQITNTVTQAATKQVMDNLRQQGVIK